MMWGKIAGLFFGYLLGGVLGALLGLWVGHLFDRALRGAGIERQGAIQSVFFQVTFQVMGCLAKADGRVHEDEIAFARAVMNDMALTDDQRRAAIGFFQEGKQRAFVMESALSRLVRICGHRKTLLRMFIEIQLQAAYADGVLHARERDVLLAITDRLGISRRDFAYLDAMIRAAKGFGERAAPAAARDRVKQAYEVLGVTAQATDAEIKRAYRRLMSRHHPDKLVAKGLPEEMMRLAKEKTQEIQRAYETIRGARQASTTEV